MKKLLLLGGLRYLIPVIKKAQEMGIYVITCDYLPQNIAHQYADEFHNVSIIDKEAVLALARQLQIDGIMSFAVDPGVVTAAYVAEKMGLPFAGSYESVRILQNKDLFRAFLTKNGFNVPKSAGYSDKNLAEQNLSEYSFPIIVKPVDSAGSKGVKRVDEKADFGAAFDYALQYSASKRIIVEEFIEQDGYASDSDCFSVDGKLVFASFSNQMFDSDASNPYTPAAYVWPSSMPMEHQTYLTNEIQRLIKLLNLKSSVYNVETRVSTKGVPYIMEVSPRGGGNRISEILSRATSVDLIEAAVKYAVGETYKFPDSWSYNGVWSEMILYANNEGHFNNVEINSKIQSYINELDVWVEKGVTVHPFTGANETIGTMVCLFNNREELESKWSTIRSKVHILVD